MTKLAGAKHAVVGLSKSTLVWTGMLAKLRRDLEAKGVGPRRRP